LYTALNLNSFYFFPSDPFIFAKVSVLVVGCLYGFGGVILGGVSTARVLSGTTVSGAKFSWPTHGSAVGTLTGTNALVAFPEFK
jgi:hypothetical protein